MQVTIGKILGLLVAIGYVAIFVVAEHGFTRNVLRGCGILVLPLVLIWFPEQLGSFTGYAVRGSTVDTETPPILVSLMGWFFLVGLPVVAYLMR